MNSVLTALGMQAWKPILAALLLPPVPFLLLLLVGARLILPRRGLGWFVILLSVTGIYLNTCVGTAQLIDQFVLHVPAPIKSDQIAQLREAAKRNDTAIVVLGAGVEAVAPEYGVSNLTPYSLERLRYALWLSKETNLPVAFSGGVGWSQTQSGSEAETAARIAQQEFARPLKWQENLSRDTRENAEQTLPMLKRDGITHVVLVTHGWHMPRARTLFKAVAQTQGMQVDIAPMGLARRVQSPLYDWLPTNLGFMRVRQSIKEGVASLVGG